MANIKNYCEINTWRVDELQKTIDDIDGYKKRKLEVPKYQRSLVWSKEQKVGFIKSLRQGFPVGSFLLYRKGHTDKGFDEHVLIDGLQRTQAIREYLKNPASFIDIDDIDQGLIKLIQGKLSLGFDEVGRQELLNAVLDWFGRLQSLEAIGGYDAYRFMNYLLERFDPEKKDMISTIKQLQDDFYDPVTRFLYDIKENTDIRHIQIPVIIYEGDENNLPEIFEKINSKGTKLNRYQIFAASWVKYGDLEITNREIVSSIRQKYEILEDDEGYEIDDYSKEDKNFNYFEYVFGFGKWVTKRFPYLFDQSNLDITDSTGFNILSACLAGGTRTENLNKLPEVLKKINSKGLLNQLEDKVIESIDLVDNCLAPFISLKTNRQKNDDRPRIVHSDMQMVSLIAKVFVTKYDENLTEKISEQDKKIQERLKNNIHFYYLADILRDVWRGSGDARLQERLKSGSQYDKEISHEEWENILGEFFNRQLNKKEKSRALIKIPDTILLNFIYTHIHSFYDNKQKVYHIDHIIPVKILSDLAVKDKIDGLPISHVANLCFLTDKVNSKKWKKDVIDFYNEQVAENSAESLDIIKDLKQQLLIDPENEESVFFINQGKISRLGYEKFLSFRYKQIKDKFYSLNKIPIVSN